MGDTVLDLGLLAAFDYNRIKCFEEQQTISQNHLRALGDIYVRTKMHHSYSVGILHRHVPLYDGYIMVHTLCDNGMDVCKAENVKDLDCHNIIPHSFCLNSKGHFQAYEYDSGVSWNRPLPNADFLVQLRSFLVKNRLTEVVAILAEDSRQDSVEFLLADEQGMVSIPRKEGYARIDVGQPVITGCRFYEGPEGTIKCIQRRGCDPKDDGQHKINNDLVQAVGSLVTNTSRN